MRINLHPFVKKINPQMDLQILRIYTSLVYTFIGIYLLSMTNSNKISSIIFNEIGKTNLAIAMIIIIPNLIATSKLEIKALLESGSIVLALFEIFLLHIVAV